MKLPVESRVVVDLSSTSIHTRVILWVLSTSSWYDPTAFSIEGVHDFNGLNVHLNQISTMEDNKNKNYLKHPISIRMNDSTVLLEYYYFRTTPILYTVH